MAVRTPLKWAGSKASIMDKLKAHLPAGQRLVEPFAGSCVVMMNTDYPAYLIADINPDLVNTYKMMAYHTDALMVELEMLFCAGGVGRVSDHATFYYCIREAFNNDGHLSNVEKAARFIYLNRHGYRGLCRYNKSRGHFNNPYGHYKKPYFPEVEIRAFAEKAKRATFICASYEETLQLVCPGDVVYCDPPYNPVSRTSNFTQYHGDGFSEVNQAGLAGLLESLAEDVPVIASNSDSDLTHNHYRNFERHIITAPRKVKIAAGEGKEVPEVIAKRSPELIAVGVVPPGAVLYGLRGEL